jgi:predicted NBD/HSP70 family sugar kinase
VLGPDGRMQRLFGLASMSALSQAMEAAGESSDHLFEQNLAWHVSDGVLSAWLDGAAEGLASAILSAATLLELEAVLIDGWMPAHIRTEITDRTRAALHRLDLAGVEPPDIREGTVGPEARALGAAAIPLSQRYLIDQNAAAREG